ncbi:MAG TPA: MFS transporter [Chloroflexota bacterium]|nr:MFS transporter [Chloroflexota bacterium]
MEILPGEAPVKAHGAAAEGSGVRTLLSEPPRPEWLRRRPDAYWWVVGTVCIGAFLGQLDASIVTLALPTIRNAFHVGIGYVEWVALAYLLTLVVTVVAVGRFADMAGRKLLYTYGFAIFILGSGLCGLSPDFAVLVVARILQAFGASMLQANSVALIAQAMPKGKLGRGIGVQGAAQAIGLAAGPAVGGLLIGLGGWRLVFLASVPAGLAGMILGWLFLPRTRHLRPHRPFDWPGFLLFIPGIGLPLVALSLWTDFAPSPALRWVLPLLGGICLALFVYRELHARFPLVALSLLRRVSFSGGLAAGLLSYMVMFGVLFVVPFYLEAQRGLGPVVAGAQLTLLPVALGVAAPLAGRLSDRLDRRLVTVGGMSLTVLGLACLALLRRPEPVLLLDLALIGAGLGMFTPANNAGIVSAVPAEEAGLAGGILNMTRGLGTALGVAVTGLVFGSLSARASGVSAAARHNALLHGFLGAVALLVMASLLATVLSLRPEAEGGGGEEAGVAGGNAGGDAAAYDPGIVQMPGELELRGPGGDGGGRRG